MKTELNTMPDVQGRRDLRELPIQRVGVKSLRYPLRLMMAGQVQPTVGTWTLDVALAAEQKGAHMSRLIAWLEALEMRGTVLTAETLSVEISAMLTLLEADAGRIEVRFPFFVRKAAPVSGLHSLMEYDGSWIAERQGGVTRLTHSGLSILVAPTKSAAWRVRTRISAWLEKPLAAVRPFSPCFNAIQVPLPLSLKKATCKTPSSSRLRLSARLFGS